jgi:hypothetical protein
MSNFGVTRTSAVVGGSTLPRSFPLSPIPNVPSPRGFLPGANSKYLRTHLANWVDDPLAPPRAPPALTGWQPGNVHNLGPLSETPFEAMVVRALALGDPKFLSQLLISFSANTVLGEYKAVYSRRKQLSQPIINNPIRINR